MKTHALSALGPLLAVALIAAAPASASPDDASILRPLDVFELEWASDPQISPDGSRIVYVRNFMDIMSDARRSNLWIIDFDGSRHRPLTSGNNNNASPRWSPDGDRLAFISTEDGSAQLHMRWMDTGATAKISNLQRSPGGLTWSPDGTELALSMRIPADLEPMAKMPPKPAGAEWAEPARVIEHMTYRFDGAGFLDPGFRHLFVVPAEGGSPRQITSGDFNHSGSFAWGRDGRHLIVSVNRSDNWEYEPLDSELYAVSVAEGGYDELTDRRGPDSSPTVSPDGSKIAYLGFDDKELGYHNTRLYVADRNGSKRRVVTNDLDRSVQDLSWSDDGKGLFITYSTEGNGKIAYLGMNGKMEPVADHLGNSIGRPYSGGSFSVSASGRVAFTTSPPEHPADVAVVTRDSEPRRLTNLNADLLDHKTLAQVEELWWESSHDGRRIQGWVATPPNFDPSQKYPLILEIHGGPFANYGDRFSGEVQLFAAAGYVVLYANPRGSTSYGDEFANLIHHNYPGQDYDDLMSGIDAVLAKGFVDESQLFVTGGSGGGVLTAWIVGMTDRFAAAVSAKPVINWYSFVLTADFYNLFYKYWFSGFPWDVPEEYLARSPLHKVGNVSTPTMLLTGEVDYRTPMSESEQFYQALKLRKIDTALVRIPGASHSIANRPSQLITKINHVLAWFERYRPDEDDSEMAP